MKMKVALLLLVFHVSFIAGQRILGQHFIKQKIVTDVADIYEDYWVLKANGTFNKPTFDSYISFYNKQSSVAEYRINCKNSESILYYQNELIFLTTGHTWSADNDYYITIDQGALMSNGTHNSTAFTSSSFWTFTAKIPRDSQNNTEF